LIIKTNEFFKNFIVNQLNEELNFDNYEDNSYPINFYNKRKIFECEYRTIKGMESEFKKIKQ